MLVLTRRQNEKIVLPGLNITIQVLDLKGGRVRIGIDAPPDVKILRSEVVTGFEELAMSGEPVGAGHY